MRDFVRTTLVWLLLAVVGQNLLAPHLTLWGVAPDFAIIALVILALAEGASAGALGGFAIGLMEDLSTPPLLGLHALCKTFLGFSLGRMRSHLIYGMPVVEGVIVAVSVLGHDTVYLMVRSGLGDEPFLRPLFLQALPAAVYSGLVGIPLLRLADLCGVFHRDD